MSKIKTEPKQNKEEDKIAEVYNRCHEYYKILREIIIRKNTTNKKITTSDWLDLRHELTLLHGSLKAKEYFQERISEFITDMTVEIAEVFIFLFFFFFLFSQINTPTPFYFPYIES